jgi:hypothetical protein
MFSFFLEQIQEWVVPIHDYVQDIEHVIDAKIAVGFQNA